MDLLNINLLVQEFYAVEAVSVLISSIQHSSFEPMRHSHSRWHQDFSDFREEYILKFASAIYDYTVLVVAAELRHADRKASHYIKGYYPSTYFRDQVYRECTIYKAGDILAAGMKLFDTRRVEWDDGFGGEKWKCIAKAGLVKGKVSDCIFIDHCVDLSHNNSIYFDKHAGIFCLQSKENYQTFLDLKRFCEPQALIREKKGRRFNQLLWRANNLGIVESCQADGLISPEYDLAESRLFDYHPVQWGDKPLDSSDCNIGRQAEFCDVARRENEERFADDYDVRYEYEKCA